jgi:potassium-transporting ATPase A subunit
MVGRTPEYLGKKIESREVRLASLAILILPASILGLTAISVLAPAGFKGPLNPGAHGFSEILHAFSSTTGNNGSAFAGLTGNTPYYNTTLSVAMWLGRFIFGIPILALAGALAGKKVVPASAGTFATDTTLFAGLLVGVIIIVGALTLFPALALGPILDHSPRLPSWPGSSRAPVAVPSSSWARSRSGTGSPSSLPTSRRRWQRDAARRRRLHCGGLAQAMPSTTVPSPGIRSPALNILLAALTIIFMFAVVTLQSSPSTRAPRSPSRCSAAEWWR